MLVASFKQSFPLLVSTVRALLIREMMIRYRRENFGFAWLFLEPMVLTVSVMVLWRIMYGTNNHGVSVLVLVLSGYSLLTFWRHIVGRSMLALKLSFDLKYHRSVQYGDVIFARYLLEFLAVMASFWIIYICLYFMGFVGPVYDITGVTMAWLLFAFLSTGGGIIIVALTEFSETVMHYIQPLLYVTVPLTGAFFMVHWLPEVAQDVVLWSPFVHCVEMLRHGMLGPSVPTTYDPYYVFFCALCAHGFGWTVFNHVKTRVEPLI